MKTGNNEPGLPGEGLDVATMPAYRLLGKRVLRPGGMRLTRSLLEGLRITPDDVVVELAPGLGTTTRLIIGKQLRAYIGVERDHRAADIVGALLPRNTGTCLVGTTAKTQLAGAGATVVLGEAFRSMQPDRGKGKILAEAFPILAPGGRYGLHELALTPGTLTTQERDDIRADLSSALHVGARPLTVAHWPALLEDAGLEIQQETTAPMRLLSPRRVVDDEGLLGAVAILSKVLDGTAVRARVGSIRSGLARHRDHLCAVALVATKPT